MENKNDSEDLKAIHFLIPTDMHFDIKMIALKRNITMTKWIERALYKALLEEKKGETNE